MLNHAEQKTKGKTFLQEIPVYEEEPEIISEKPKNEEALKKLIVKPKKELREKMENVN